MTDNITNATAAAAMYRVRDAHEIFFHRPRFQRLCQRVNICAGRRSQLYPNHPHSLTNKDSNSHVATSSCTMDPTSRPRQLLHCSQRKVNPTTTTLLILPTVWSPKILGHQQPASQQPNHSLAFTTPPVTPSTAMNDSPTLSAAWSPKFLVYHHHPQSSEDHMTSQQTTHFQENEILCQLIRLQTVQLYSNIMVN